MRDFAEVLYGWVIFCFWVCATASLVWGIGLALIHIFPAEPVVCYYSGNTPPPEPLIERRN